MDIRTDISRNHGISIRTITKCDKEVVNFISFFIEENYQLRKEIIMLILQKYEQ